MRRLAQMTGLMAALSCQPDSEKVAAEVAQKCEQTAGDFSAHFRRELNRAAFGDSVDHDGYVEAFQKRLAWNCIMGNFPNNEQRAALITAIGKAPEGTDFNTLLDQHIPPVSGQ